MTEKEKRIERVLAKLFIIAACGALVCNVVAGILGTLAAMK